MLLGVEVNADMLSDKFNSKKAGNVDWQFNALAGLTFRFGKTYRKKAAAVPPAPVAPAAPAEPAPEQPAPEPRPEPAPAPAPVPVAEKPVPLREDIFFRIGSSEIRASERPKVEALADYLRAHPETTVSVTGYADAATGGKARNLQLSMLCAAGVSEALQQAGIAAGNRIPGRLQGRFGAAVRHGGRKPRERLRGAVIRSGTPGTAGRVSINTDLSEIPGGRHGLLPGNLLILSVFQRNAFR